MSSENQHFESEQISSATESTRENTRHRMAKLEAANLSLVNMRLKEPRTIHGIGKVLLRSILSMVKDTIRYDITKNAVVSEPTVGSRI